jgi:hypothetical protein
MSDEAWRAHERRWRQEPSDQEALGLAITGMRRSGLVVPPDLLDARVEPATALETTLPLEVWAVLPGEREPKTVGWGPGRVEVPPHRYWGVGDVPAGLEGLGALGDELRGRGIPGLRLPQLSRSRHQVGDDDPHLDRDGLAALGPQAQLRWLDLPRRGVQWVTPGQVVRALRCTGLEVFRGEFLLGDTRADEVLGARLEGFEQLRHLRELALDECPVLADDLRTLAGLPELDSVSILGAALGAGQLVGAGLGPRLRGLSVDVPLGEADLAALSELGGLTRLRAGLDHVSPAIAGALVTALPRLTTLELQEPGSSFEVPLLDEALQRLTTSRLERLVLVSGARIGDEGLAAVRSIPTLRAFGGGARHLHEAPSSAADFRPLESLDVQCGGPCWPALAQAEQLRELWLHGGAADEALDALGLLPALGRLSLSVGRASRTRTLRLPRLESLELRDPLIGTELHAPLRSLRLQRERRPGTFHGAEGSLAKLERLELLTGLGDADLAPLQRLQSLRVLELRLIDRIGSDLSDRVLELLRALPGLRRVRLGAGSGDPGSLAEVHRVARGWIADELPWIAVVD